MSDKAREFIYCPYCGTRLEYEVYTDATSPKICKYAGCPKQKPWMHQPFWKEYNSEEE